MQTIGTPEINLKDPLWYKMPEETNEKAFIHLLCDHVCVCQWKSPGKRIKKHRRVECYERMKWFSDISAVVASTTLDTNSRGVRVKAG